MAFVQDKNSNLWRRFSALAARLSMHFSVLFVAVLAFGVFNTQRKIETTQNELHVYYPPPPQLVHFSFGFRNTFSDMLWIRSLQDLDYCEKKISEKECVAKGWLFKIIDLATELDPSFVMPHSYGALSLSIIVSDKQGATAIFEKAVARFPQYWVIPYWAGYHALYEESNPNKAANYMEKAARSGAPQWVFSLASRLYTDTGRKEVAANLIKELESSNFDPDLLKRMKKKLSTP